jgi:hypothetical protein
MQKHKIKTIQDIAPHVQEHLLPEIKEAVEVCTKAYWDDPAFNDMWTFGTHFWRNTWNRLKSVAGEYEDCPFELFGKGNEYKLKIGPFVIRHHRINNQSKLPTGAKAVKSSANFIQMSLFNDEWDAPVEIDNIILAIDADVERGLKEVFVGEIMSLGPNSKKYRWVNKAPVFLADAAEASTAEIVQIEDMIEPQHLVPEEEAAKVSLHLVKPKKKARDGESEGD